MVKPGIQGNVSRMQLSKSQTGIQELDEINRDEIPKG